jgi:hypothetical protein
MRQQRLLVAAIASLLIPTAQASVELIAVGGLSGHGHDLSAETVVPLENGVSGNLLGGLGSALAYAGGNTFLALPDRGPNAAAYNALVSDTTSYINRFQTLRMSLTPAAAAGSALPFDLTPTLTATTLLHVGQPLRYSDGVAAGLPSGAPALNQVRHTNYLTGRADNFDAFRLSTDRANGRLDPEGLRVSNDGASVFLTDEYGPYVYRFNRKSGLRTGVYALPDSFAVMHQSANGDEEISANSIGRVGNKGMEGLAISPDGATLFGIMQSPLLQDGATAAPYTRIVRIDLATGATAQFAYPLSNIGSASKPKYSSVSEIVAINNHEFLVDERDGKGLGDNSTAVVKRVYRIDLNGATDVSGFVGSSALAPYAVGKSLFLDLVAALGAHGFPAANLPAKLEGMSSGPDVIVDGTAKHTLWIANDNDFIGTVTDSLHPAGIENPNLFFVFAVDAGDLPRFEAQALVQRPH